MIGGWAMADKRVESLTQAAPMSEADLLASWNNTSVDYPAPHLLHAAFERHARNHPGDVAVVAEGEALTYGELNSRANQLAHLLLDTGVVRGSLVGVFMERSLEMVIALYATAKAGGAYVPLDPEYPNERLAYMIGDAAMPVVLIQERLRESLPEVDARVIAVDTEWERAADLPKEDLSVAVGPDDIAYVIFTSGSTGRPKGVMNSHRGIYNRLIWMQEFFGLSGSDSVLQKTPFSFDVSVWEFFWPLMVGARLVMAQPGGHRDAGYLIHTIVENEITTIHFVPSMLRLFLEHPEADSCRSLQRVICSGEALTADLRDRFYSRLDTGFFNLYGPTEAAVDVTYWVCRQDGDAAIVPIGRPVANTQIHILDKDLRPVPVGDVGELHIGGVQVATGYLNRPELTAERFIPDPFSEIAGARLYKSGDLARFLPDGNVEVKIRGNRVELGEIEATLLQHPNVKHAAVIAEDDGRGGQRLVGHVVCQDPRPSLEEIRSFLEGKLPGYMNPGKFIFHDGFSLTSSGKVDRQSLLAFGRARPQLDTAYVAPRDDLERFVAELWAEILGLDSIGANDRFFDLGGDSLQAADFINRLQSEFGEFIYVITVFQSPTVAQYAAFLNRDYGAAISRRFGQPGTDPTQPTTPHAGRERRLGESAVARLQAAVPTFAPFERWDDESPNRQAIFILAPPRSGTSLLRVMLAGHPDLFAASELQLLGFDTLQQRRAAFSGAHSLWLEGTIRAVMELRDVDAEAAKEVMDSYERKDATSKEFYGELQDWIGERTLVDKSPAYAFDPDVLNNAETGFAQPLYIHLVRDPYSMVKSFENYHMDQVLFLEEHPYSPAELAELVWLLSHRNIMEFFDQVPPERRHRLLFDDLVTRPEESMRTLSAAMGFDYDPALVTPYEDLDHKMVDGIHPSSIPMGDTRLLEHGRIDPDVAGRWGKPAAELLSDATLELAAALGAGTTQTSPSGEGSGRGRGRRRLADQARNRRQRHRGDGQ